MRKVQFEYKRVAGTSLIWYPDVVDLFANSEIIGNLHISDYSGTDTGIEDYVLPSEPVVNHYFVHIEFDDTLNESPPGLKNDGVDTVGITLTVRSGESPSSSVTPITNKYRMVFKDENESQFGVVKLQFTAGVATFNYKTREGGRTATIHLSESDLAQLAPAAEIKVIGENLLVIYEDFT